MPGVHVHLIKHHKPKAVSLQTQCRSLQRWWQTVAHLGDKPGLPRLHLIKQLRALCLHLLQPLLVVALYLFHGLEGNVRQDVLNINQLIIHTF